MATLEERFWAKVDKTTTPDGCWLWTASCFDHGYGSFWDGRHTVEAHRMAWILVHGLIPSGMWVLHSCDVRACVNPGHLWLGTHMDNVQDRIEKERQSFAHSGVYIHHKHISEGLRRWAHDHPERVARGEGHWSAKLTAIQVREIRELHVLKSISSTALAERFGVSQGLISRIVHKKRWTHI